jgi:hypothetical protein
VAEPCISLLADCIIAAISLIETSIAVMDFTIKQTRALIGVIMRNDPVKEYHHPCDQEGPGFYFEVSSQTGVLFCKINNYWI